MSRQQVIVILRAISFAGLYGGLLMPVVYFPGVVWPYSFAKLIALQITIGLTFPAYLALAWMEPKFRPPRSAPYAAILVYFCVILVLAVFSVDSARSWWGSQARMTGIFSLLHFLAWLTMTVGLLKNWDVWAKLLNVQIVLAFSMALVALLQIPYPKLVGSPTGVRVSGLLGNPNFMGTYQLLNLSFIALIFMRTTSKFARAWYGIAAAVCLAALISTRSRGEFLGLVVIIGVFGLYYAILTTNKALKSRAFVVGIGIFALYALAIVLRSSTSPELDNSLSRLLDFHELPTTRLLSWTIAWNAFLERPIAGWGFDTFYILFNQDYNPMSLEFGYYETWADRVHNKVLEVLATTGLLGFCTYIAIFVALFAAVWRARKKGWLDLSTAALLTAVPVGYFVQNLFLFDHPAGLCLSYLAFALVICSCRPGGLQVGGAEHEDHANLTSRPHSMPWTGFVVLQIVFLVIVWRYSVIPFRASALSIKGTELLRAGQIDPGYEYLKQAAMLPTPFTDEQPFFLSRELLGLASRGALARHSRWPEIYEHTKELSQRHMDAHPKDTHSILIYARFVHELIQMQPEEERERELRLAISLYEHAIETSPRRQQAFFGLGELYRAHGRSVKALETFEKALSFNENIGSSWWRVGRTKWSDMKDSNGAKDIMTALAASVPFQYETARDALVVAEVAQHNDDMKLLYEVLNSLSSMRGARVDVLLDIARVVERAGRIQDRNQILAVLVRSDANLARQLGALNAGLVQTIDESIAHALVEAESDKGTIESVD